MFSLVQNFILQASICGQLSFWLIGSSIIDFSNLSIFLMLFRDIFIFSIYQVGRMHFCRAGKCWQTPFPWQWCRWSDQAGWSFIICTIRNCAVSSFLPHSTPRSIPYPSHFTFSTTMLHTSFISNKVILSKLFQVFKLLGTPTEDTWQGMASLPDYKPFPLYQPSLSLGQVDSSDMLIGQFRLLTNLLKCTHWIGRALLRGALKSLSYTWWTFFDQVVPKLPGRGRDLLSRLLVCNPAGRWKFPSSFSPKIFPKSRWQVEFHAIFPKIFHFLKSCLHSVFSRLSAAESMNHIYFSDLSQAVKSG